MKNLFSILAYSTTFTFFAITVNYPLLLLINFDYMLNNKLSIYLADKLLYEYTLNASQIENWLNVTV